MAKKNTTKKRTAATSASGKAPGSSSRVDRGELSTVSMAALRAELDRRLATLQRKREDLKQQLSKLDEEIAWCDGEFAAASDRRKGRAAGRKRAKNQVNLVQALEQVLKRRTLSVTDMSEAVQKAGYRTTSPNFRTIVNQTLINNPQLFKRVARGKYTLAGRKGLRD